MIKWKKNIINFSEWRNNNLITGEIMILSTLKEALLNAWSMLIEFPLPFLKHDEEEDIVTTENSVLLTQAFFPVIGLICALLALLLGELLGRFLYPIPAAAVFAGIATYFCVYKDDGRGLAGLMFLTSSKQEGTPFQESLSDLPESISDVNTPTATLTMIMVVLFKLFAFFLMAFYGYIYWLVAICVLEFTIEADLATLPSLQGQPLLKVKKSKQRYVWFIAGFLLLFVLLKAYIAIILLFAAALGLNYAVKTYCEGRLNGIDSKIIGLTAYVFELFALLLGIIILTKGQIIPIVSL
jgi:cobalamin synthase